MVHPQIMIGPLALRGLLVEQFEAQRRTRSPPSKQFLAEARLRKRSEKLALGVAQEPRLSASPVDVANTATPQHTAFRAEPAQSQGRVDDVHTTIVAHRQRRGKAYTCYAFVMLRAVRLGNETTVVVLDGDDFSLRRGTMKQRIGTFLAGGLLALALFGAAAAGPLEEGEAAFQKDDYATALQLLRPLANQGDADGQVTLGEMYREGRGVPQDYAQAVAWFRKAADQGSANGQSSLGLMYEAGWGVPQDYVLAHMWYNLAASRAVNDASKGVAAIYRDLVAAKMTPAQIAEAQRLAREWKPK